MVSVAASGEDALTEMAEQAFDVVVSDMGMGGGMNGWELAGAVKQRWPSVRFLLATGWGAAIDPGEARIRGVEAVLSTREGVCDAAGARDITEELTMLTASSRVHPVSADLTEPDGPGRLVTEAISAYGRLDILVNNVGAVQPRLNGFLSNYGR
jgi:DNA-binding NarL/FixJ family response regulator